MIMVYLAARYGRKDELKEYTRQLTEYGWITTSRWLDTTPAMEAGPGRAMKMAMWDLHDIKEADVFVGFLEDNNDGAKGRGGRHVELGYALGLGKPVYLIGKPENVFHYLPQVLLYPDWSSFIKVVETNSQ